MGEKGNDDPGLLAALQASSPELARKALEVHEIPGGPGREGRRRRDRYRGRDHPLGSATDGRLDR